MQVKKTNATWWGVATPFTDQGLTLTVKNKQQSNKKEAKRSSQKPKPNGYILFKMMLKATDSNRNANSNYKIPDMRYWYGNDHRVIWKSKIQSPVCSVLPFV